MENFENIRFLLSSEEKIKCEDFASLEDLVNFTLQENGKSDRITKLNHSNYEYSFKYKNKNYPFSFFSNRKLQEFDIKTLFDKQKREQVDYARTLKLACSMDIINPKVLVGKSNFNGIILLFSFLEDEEEKIVDYSKNLVMKKKDYFDVFEMKIFNELDKYDLYRFFGLIEVFNSFELQMFFLLFSKEILTDLGRNYPYLTAKYGEDGINRRNYTLFSDDLFFKNCDNQNQLYYKTRERIDAFTLNPKAESDFVCYDEEKKRYIYFDEEFGGFVFRLLSDIVSEEEEKILLSENRYHNCHENAIPYTFAFFEKQYPTVQMVSLVSGSATINEIDVYYHSWIEMQLPNEVIVIDYNHNIIMRKEDYYKLYGIKVISITPYPQLKENLDFLLKIWNPHFFPCQFNYFGNEMTRDLKRNIHLFKKEQE